MNKNINAVFSIVGLISQIFYFCNAFNIWCRHIGISLVLIYDSFFKILIVIIGLVLVFISMIFYKDNYRFSNIINYVAVIILIASTGVLVVPW